MLLGDAIAAALPELRAQALSMMTDRCIIREPDAWPDEVLTEGTVAWMYAGTEQLPCRIKTTDTMPQTVTVGGQTVPTLRLRVSLPIEIVPVKDQVVTIISAVSDPALAGRRFDVQISEVGSQLTARRVWCQEHDARLG